MQIVETIAALREAVKGWRQAGETVAFVPTMGNLHEGHLSLVELAASQADHVIVSIFVNPTQFGPNEDFDRYPRTLHDDCKKLQSKQVAAVFAPSVTEMYGENGLERVTQVHVPGLSDILCGAGRPGHFDGVATVVTRLFNIVQADIAVFGEKDFQQLTIIRKMVDDLRMPVKILSSPTAREAGGLAMSSRNQYLNDEERQIAPRLQAAMQACVAACQRGEAIANITKNLLDELAEQGFRPEYAEIRRQTDLQPATENDRACVLLVAAHLGRTRLIDNIAFQL